MNILVLIFLFSTSILKADYFDSPDTTKPLLRKIEFHKQRAYPFDNIPEKAIPKALAQSRNIKKKYVTPSVLASEPEWQCIGPYSTGGRIKSIAPHPKDKNTWYIGAANGGIWKTEDMGESWRPVFDFENSIAFGSLAIDPNNPEIIYAATGEAVMGSGNAFHGSGVYKTTDGGVTWKIIGLSEVGAFSKIYVHPLNSNRIVAGAIENESGFYVSDDAGKTWEKRLDRHVTDVSYNPDDPDDYIIGVNGDGVFRTKDAGKSWVKKSAGFPAAGLGRISCQFAKSNPEIMYSLMDSEDGENALIYKSVNGGNSWQKMYEGGYNFFRGQGYYNNFITVHPKNPSLVLAGGIDLWRSINGGKNWENISDRAGDDVAMHVDQHHAAFSPADDSIVMVGNDGGVYLSINHGSYWIKRNNNLQVTQFYAFAFDAGEKHRLFGGTQDNGTLGNISPVKWKKFAGGDGFDVIIDPVDPNIIYGEYQYGTLWKAILDDGNIEAFYGIGDMISNDRGAWHSPLAVDPSNPGVFYHGRGALYVSYFNKGEDWKQITPKSDIKFTAIAVSKKDFKVIFAGNQIGQVIMSPDAGANWYSVHSHGLVNRYVTDIATSKYDRETAYVAFSGYGTPHIFKTTDMGESWINVSETLPDVPCNDIEIHPENEEIIFAATDIGVYVTFDGGNIWFPYGKGLPNSPVTEIKIHNNPVVLPEMTLRASTYGRSIWETVLPKNPEFEPKILEPAGGEIFTAGYNTELSWLGFELPVDVYYSSNDGEQWELIAENISGNEFNWNLPRHYSFNSRIKVVSKSNGTGKISDLFTVRLKEKGDRIITRSLPFTPYGVANSSRKLYIASFYDASIFVYDERNLKPLNRIVFDGTDENSRMTDLAIDGANRLFVHILDAENNEGNIIGLDTLGNVFLNMASPAVNYPMGLAVAVDNLYITERDNARNVFVMDISGSSYNYIGKNPYGETFGPRGLTYSDGEFYQICTGFQSSRLSESFIGRLPDDFSKVETAINLRDGYGIMNARGIATASTEGDFWVTDFSGSIHKIAGDDEYVSVREKRISGINLYPNPPKNYLYMEGLDFSGRTEFEIYGLAGQRITTGEISNEEIIDIKSLNNGFYFLILKNDGRVILKEKFIKVGN